MNKVIALVAGIALLGWFPSTSGIAQETTCRICDAGPSCVDAELGYRNCSVAGSSCANWEPLCEQDFLNDTCEVWRVYWCW